MCPWCQQTATYRPPERIERPPAVVGTATTTTDDHTIARLFFEGGAWLQYRETSDGRIREETFTADGELIESSNAETESEDCDLAELYDPPEEYLRRAVERYETYTPRGLRIHQPHVATTLLERQ